MSKKIRKPLPPVYDVEVHEEVLKWSELSENRKIMTLTAYLKLLEISPTGTGILLRVFDIGNPTMVFDEKNRYLRIEKDSLPAFSHLLKQYL